MNRLGTSELDVFPLCLGGNVFGWTADVEASHEVLDAYVAAGGNFVDTADTYSRWVAGNRGGESEEILGEWMQSRGNRDALVLATKVGEEDGLTRDNILKRADDSLRRLRTDRIDLYYAHFDDPDTPLVEALGAFDEVVRAGNVRYVAASNYSAARLSEALAVQEREGFARFVALQPHYNLVEREFEGELAGLARKHDLACVPYFGLASGFLTGKWRPGVANVDTRRGDGATQYLDETGMRLLEVLDATAARYETTVAAVSLAWLISRPSVASVIASARSADQLSEQLPAVELELDSEALEQLTGALVNEHC